MLKKVLLLSLLLSSLLYSKDSLVKTYIPVNAKSNLIIVYKEVDNILPGINNKYYFSALIEQESCVRLKGNGYYARRCWSPVSELLTYWDKDKTIMRENGIGFFQLTRAYRKSGRLRFDTIRNLRKKYPKDLHELTWLTVKKRPDLQIKAGILLWKSNYNMFSKDISKYDRMCFSDSVYNGGFKYFNRERKLCKMTVGCNPTIWFDNVESMKSSRAKRKLYGNRSAWDINRDHVDKVMKVRLNKYREDYLKRFDKDTLISINSDSSITKFYGE